jgi:broad specificity phosphatase PhoE
VNRNRKMTSIPRMYDVVFVRHAISCANLRKEVNPHGFPWKDHYKLPDPSLTPNGIAVAIKRGKALREKLNTDFPGQAPIVCASTLMRAQLTAYLMMYPKIVHVIPYISELGFPQTPDNTPYSYEEQREILKGVGITRKTNINKNYTTIKPNSDYFSTFLGGMIDNLYASQADKSQAGKQYVKPLFVIFTHGHFIEKLLKKNGIHLKGKGDRPNYSAWRFRFNKKKGKLIPYAKGSKEAIDDVSYIYTKDTDDQIDKDKECASPDIENMCGINICNKKKSIPTPLMKQVSNTLATLLKPSSTYRVTKNNSRTLHLQEMMNHIGGRTRKKRRS